MLLKLYLKLKLRGLTKTLTNMYANNWTALYLHMYQYEISKFEMDYGGFTETVT